MASATLHRADVGGFAGPARCYQLDPPMKFAGQEYRYVTIWVQKEYAHQGAEVCIVPATESGACALPSVRKLGGSITLHDTPDTADYVNGVHFLALQALGGYSFEVAR